MKKLSILAGTALSLLLLACGEDSVSGVDQPVGGNGGQSGPVAVLDSSRNMSLDLKGCYGHPYDALTKTAAENPKAYLVHNGAGYHVVLSNVVDACGYTDIVFNNQRVLDTLKVNFEANSTDCICITDDWFTIDPFDADIKYFEYLGTVYEVVTEPLPVRSSSSAAIESSSEMALSSAVVSSSSEQPLLSSSVDVSSSSAEPQDPSHVIVTDATADCRTTSNIDPMLDGSVDEKLSDAALPPVAYRYVGPSRTGFTIENISMTCNISIDSMDVYVSGETVYVTPKLNYAEAQRCLCESRVQFSLPNDPAYYKAKYLVFDDGSSVNFQNKMEIYDMDVITVDEASAF